MKENRKDLFSFVPLLIIIRRTFHRTTRKESSSSATPNNRHKNGTKVQESGFALEVVCTL